MTDLITRARSAWCDPCTSTFTDITGASVVTDNLHYPCPPSVVAALLDVLDKLNEFDVRMSQGGREALRAEAAITRALEGK